MKKLSDFNRRRLPRRKMGGAAAPIFFVLLAVCALAIFYFASFSKGTNDVFEDENQLQPDPELAEKKLAESRSAESEFNSIHEFKKEQITDKDLDLFEKAVNAYRDYLAYAGMTEYNPRYEQIRRRLHDLRADSIRRRTSLMESQAEDLAMQKKYDEAESLFSKACVLENRIAKEFPLASKKNHARITFLDSRARTMRAIPMQIRAKELEAQGEAALNAADWQKAREHFVEALAIERVLWSDYRNVVSIGTSQIPRLNALIATVNSGSDYEQRERFIAEAREAEKAGNWDRAVASWENAQEEQTLLARNYPDSLYADKSVAETIACSLADAAAHADFELLQKCREEIRAGIRAGKLDRVPLLAKQALRTAETIARDWPKNSLVSEDLLKELRYMDLKAPDIASVQHSFFELLLPVPATGTPKEKKSTVKMMKTEVSQALYTFVMPFNPSVRREHNLPVESVDFLEAQEFCHRLSLLVGQKVRLPKRAEFLAAAGTPDADALLGQAWLIENSSGQVHPVAHRAPNAAGFFDLYGNVSEWVLPEPLASDAEPALKNNETYSAGGDAQTPVYAFPKNNFLATNCSEKSRLRGFRVVVENAEDEAPADAARQQ